MTRDMDCARFALAVHEYYRGTLTGAEQGAVEEHARACPACGELKSTCEELSCKEFVGSLHEFLDGLLARERARLFERHLAICPDCSAYLDGYRATIELSVAAFDAGPTRLDEDLPEALVHAILASRSRPGGG